MSVTILERPYKYCFSKNEIRYVFNLDNLTRINLRLEVKIKCRMLVNGDDIDLSTFQLYPLPNGDIYVPISKYIDSLLFYVLPNLNNIKTTVIGQTCFFWVEYREVSNDDIDLAFDTSEISSMRIAIKGGISKEKFSRNNFFINKQEATPTFFTWQPSGKFLFYNQLYFLSLFVENTAIFDNQDCKLRFEITLLDGTTSIVNHNLSGTAVCNFIHFNVGAAFNSLPTDTHFYDVSIVDVSNNYIANPYRFYIQYRPIYIFYDLFFHNSLGGVDSARVRGEYNWEIEKEVVDGEGGFSVNENFALTKAHQNTQVSVSFTDKFKGDIGFLNSKKEQEALIELLISRSIYWLNDERWIPCLNVQKNLSIRKSTDELFSFPIEWNIAIENEHYTPTYQQLGIGDTSD